MSENRIKNHNCSIDIFRYICAIMVVAIHTKPFSDVNAELGYIFTQIIPRIGVPFFFATAGYFYIQKLERGQKAFFPYIKRLLITYFIWSCLYYLIDFIQWGNLNIKGFVVNCVYQFIIAGSHYHFWFFPALIFAVCLTTLLFKIKCRKIVIPLSFILYFIGCLGCSYYNLSVKIPILSNLFTSSQFLIVRRILLMGFPFFACGYLIYKIEDKFLKRTTNKQLFIIWIIVAVIYIAEVYTVRILKWQNNIVLTFGLYLMILSILLILLKNPFPEYKSLSNKCKLLANFTYYSHPIFILLLTVFAKNILHAQISETPLFLLTTAITFVVGIVIYKWNNKFINYFVH